MPQPYLLHVQSHPIRVARDTWEQWYTEEHLRDMVFFKASRTGALYRALDDLLHSSSSVSDPSEPTTTDHMEFLALYQTDRRHCLEHTEYKDNVRLRSELWDPGSTCHDVGSFRPTDLQLIEVLGSYTENEEVPTHLIHTKISGTQVEAWLRHEHINAASRLSGYRRTLVYRPVDEKQGGAFEREDSTRYDLGRVDSARAMPSNGEGLSVTLLHEFDGANEHDAETLRGVMTEVEKIEGSEKFAIVLRGYSLVDAEGYGGKVRKPERL